MKKAAIVMLGLLSVISMQAKTLVAYYSYTNNVERIVDALKSQIDADVVEIEPAEKGLDYAANNYAIGSQQIAAIRNNPDDASSYPAIDAVEINMNDYDMVIIACPLWWNQMAAPFQTFLFQYGRQMRGKNIGVIVSSASSGISGVVADAKRLIPEGKFLEPTLWIRSSQTSDAASMLTEWLNELNYKALTTGIDAISEEGKLEFTFRDGEINLEGDFDNLSLFSLSGQKLLETSEREINISNLTSGIYLARIAGSNGFQTQKVMIR